MNQAIAESIVVVKENITPSGFKAFGFKFYDTVSLSGFNPRDEIIIENNKVFLKNSGGVTY